MNMSEFDNEQVDDLVSEFFEQELQEVILKSNIPEVKKVADMLRKGEVEFGEFFSDHPGKHLTTIYIDILGDSLKPIAHVRAKAEFYWNSKYSNWSTGDIKQDSLKVVWGKGA